MAVSPHFKPRQRGTTTLTPKQARFVQAYLLTLNAAKAYQEAYQSTNAITAQTCAIRLLSNAKVAAAIADKQRMYAERYELTADNLLRELSYLCYSRLHRILGDTKGQLSVEQFRNLSEADQACISEIAVTETKVGEQIIKVKLHSKIEAIHLAMRHLGLLQPDSGKGESGTGLSSLLQIYQSQHIHLHTEKREG